MFDLGAAIESLTRSLADKDHAIEQCEADRQALARERDAERARADRLQATLDNLRRSIPVTSFPGTPD